MQYIYTYILPFTLSIVYTCSGSQPFWVRPPPTIHTACKLIGKSAIPILDIVWTYMTNPVYIVFKIFFFFEKRWNTYFIELLIDNTYLLRNFFNEFDWILKEWSMRAVLRFKISFTYCKIVLALAVA